jgi:hypothetical protein
MLILLRVSGWVAIMANSTLQPCEWPGQRRKKTEIRNEGVGITQGTIGAATTTRGVRTDVDEMGLMGVVQGVIDGRSDVLHQVIAVETVGNT